MPADQDRSDTPRVRRWQCDDCESYGQGDITIDNVGLQHGMIREHAVSFWWSDEPPPPRRVPALFVRTDTEMAAQFREDLRNARQMMAELLDIIEDLGGEADERYYTEMER